MNENMTNGSEVVANILSDLYATPYQPNGENGELSSYWRLRSMAADCAEDYGDQPLHDCLRWMGQNTKRPYIKPDSSPGGVWFNAATVAENLGDCESDLPENLFKALEGGKEVANHKVYPSVKEAEESFYAAWKKCGGEVIETPKKEVKKEETE